MPLQNLGWHAHFGPQSAQKGRTPRGTEEAALDDDFVVVVVAAG